MYILVLLKYSEWHNDYICLPNPRSVSNLFETFWLSFNGSPYICPKQDTVQSVLRHTWWYSWQEEDGLPRLLQLSHSSPSDWMIVNWASVDPTLSGGHRESAGISLRRGEEKRGKVRSGKFFQNEGAKVQSMKLCIQYMQKVIFIKLHSNILYLLLHTDLLFWAIFLTSSHIHSRIERGCGTNELRNGFLVNTLWLLEVRRSN